jgi:hypothetical protein
MKPSTTVPVSSVVSFDGDSFNHDFLYYKAEFGFNPISLSVDTPPLYVPIVKYMDETFGSGNWNVVWARTNVELDYNAETRGVPVPLLEWEDQDLKAELHMSNAFSDIPHKSIEVRSQNNFYHDKPDYFDNGVRMGGLFCVPSLQLMIQFRDAGVYVLHNNAPVEVLEKILLNLKPYALVFKYIERKPRASFSLVGLNPDGEFYTTRLVLPDNPMTDNMLANSYWLETLDKSYMNGREYMTSLVNSVSAEVEFDNEDIPSIYPGKGLYIVNGDPGTGKSRFLSELLLNLAKTCPHRPVLYFPPQMVELLGSPQFTSFLLQKRGAIIIAEDAENAIRAQEFRTQVISNILNFTDGITAEAMQLTLILTFNCNIAEIDPALLRVGRLKSKAEFKPLSPRRLQRAETAIKESKFPHLLDSPLPSNTFNTTGGTLAELYYQIHSQNER